MGIIGLLLICLICAATAWQPSQHTVFRTRHNLVLRNPNANWAGSGVSTQPLRPGVASMPRVSMEVQGADVGHLQRLLHWLQLRRAQLKQPHFQRAEQGRWRRRLKSMTISLAISLLFTLPHGPASASELGARIMLAFLSSQGKSSLWQMDNELSLVQSNKKYIVEVDDSVKRWINRHFTNPNDLFQTSAPSANFILEEEMKRFVVANKASNVWAGQKKWFVLAGGCAFLYYTYQLLVGLMKYLKKVGFQQQEDEKMILGRNIGISVRDTESVFDPRTGKKTENTARGGKKDESSSLYIYENADYDGDPDDTSGVKALEELLT